MPRLALLTLLLLIHPARAQLAPAWIGDWQEDIGRTHLSITTKTLTERTGGNTPRQYSWTDRRFTTIGDILAWKEKPGLYFAYDQQSLDVGAMQAILRKSWSEMEASRHTSQARSAYEAVLRQIAAITPGTYRRLRRFCVQAKDAEAECNEPDQDVFLILDGDHLVELELYQVAPEDSALHVFRKVAR